MTAREVLALKAGDLVRVDPQCVQRVSVRLADLPKFIGRPGTISGKWAVELTREIQRLTRFFIYGRNRKITPESRTALDVRVKLTVELGACQMPMRDVLQLGVGSVVKLDKIAQAPVDLYANQKRIARGEVVVVDDAYGIKITEVFGANA